MSVVKGKRKENDLQVIKELRELASHTIKCCGNESVFPKSKRWLYTQRITNEAIDALSCAVRANNIRVSEGDEDNTYRYRYMQQVEANAHLESLEVLLSLAYEILPIEGKRIEYWVGLIVSARTKLQAWIRADRKEIDIMTMLSVEKRLAALEAKVFKNKMDAEDVEAKVDYIAVCDHPEVFDEVDTETEADYESGI